MANLVFAPRRSGSNLIFASGASSAIDAVADGGTGIGSGSGSGGDPTVVANVVADGGTGTGTGSGYENVTAVRGGGIGHSKSKKRLVVVAVDGVEYRVPESQLGSFLEAVKREEPPPVAPVIKTKKKPKAKTVQSPVQVEIKSAPVEIRPIVQQQVDQTNEKIRQAWERSLIQREIEEEEETLLWLMAA